LSGSDASPPNQDYPQPTGGVLISRGVSLSLSNLSISIGPEGINGSDIEVKVSLDLTPYWLEIAAEHAKIATARHDDVLAAQRAGDSHAQSAAMEAECKASMLACAASAIALDALYSSVRDHVSIPDHVRTAWRKNRTPRHAQVSEVFRQAFAVSTTGAQLLKKNVRELFTWRDRAVHPPAEARQPTLYAELGVGAEWRFVAFSASNARLAVGAVLAIVGQLLAKPRKGRSKVAEFCKPALANVSPVLDIWEAEYGKLYERRPATDTS
jgi:hypothetical protein